MMCAQCGMQLSGSVGLCPYHSRSFDVDWAASNRIVCDFFHRGIVLPRLDKSDREEDSVVR